MPDESRPSAIQHLELAKTIVDFLGSLLLISFIGIIFWKILSTDFGNPFDTRDGEEWKPPGWKPGGNGKPWERN